VLRNITYSDGNFWQLLSNTLQASNDSNQTRTDEKKHIEYKIAPDNHMAKIFENKLFKNYQKTILRTVMGAHSYCQKMTSFGCPKNNARIFI
jgi:hypothetical protein